MTTSPDSPENQTRRPSTQWGWLVGSVFDDSSGAPISLAEVVISSETNIEYNETTDAKGRYQLSNLPSGRYHIVVVHGGRFAVANDVVVIAGQETNINHRLAINPRHSEDRHATVDSNRGVISGVIIDASDRTPLGGATVEVSGPLLNESVFTIAAGNGSFRFPDLVPGTYLISVYYSLINKGNVEVRRSGIAVKSALETKLTIDIDTQSRR